jgi:hypothetical protein
MSAYTSDGNDETGSDIDSDTEYGWLSDGHGRVNKNTWHEQNYFDHLHQNGRIEVLEAGDYFVGDINFILTTDESDALTGWMNDGERGLIQLRNGLKVVVWPTLATKRRHLDDEGREYLLGHYQIGIIKLPDKPREDSEKWQFDHYAQVLSKTMQGQIVHYEKEFSCSCYDGKVELDNGSNLIVGDQEYNKIRILNFGEQVRFTLSEHRTCEDMEIYSDPKTEKIPRWCDKNFDKPDDPLGNGVNFFAKIVHRIGFDPTEKDIEKLKRNLIWEDLHHKTNGSIIDNIASLCEKVASSMGLHLETMEDDKKKKLTDMIKTEFSRYVHENENK